ncbi:unnamed protein product [Closterium sp. NIES-54]
MQKDHAASTIQEDWLPFMEKQAECVVKRIRTDWGGDRDMTSVEGMMYGIWEKQSEAKVSQKMEQITMQLDLTPSVCEEGEEASAEGGDGEKVQRAPAGGGDGVKTSGSTSKAAGSEGFKQQ